MANDKVQNHFSTFFMKIKVKRTTIRMLSKQVTKDHFLICILNQTNGIRCYSDILYNFQVLLTSIPIVGNSIHWISHFVCFSRASKWNFKPSIPAEIHFFDKLIQWIWIVVQFNNSPCNWMLRIQTSRL